ncbi:GNAT family N-acetyltransferase [Nocardioides stalactiti]|uniref:GNAT family N-acetyltransferase n=1 Tax=Nocardioides stalactiti TaxID=2755356 RepID=UPI0016048CB6|nr:GNAT family N-acetyltransferase [Nocardioides stalactiti]
MIDDVTPDAAEALLAAARLLHDFNAEYDEPAPEPEVLAGFLRARLADGGTILLLARDDAGDPVGVAAVRLQRSLWSDAFEAYLAELYVVPPRRGEGFGRALLAAVLDGSRAAGADYVFLVTSEEDVSAQRAYEAAGFRRTEAEGGPTMWAYEQEL